jgi:hypothetical protein
MISAGAFFLLQQKTSTESYQHKVQILPIVPAPATAPDNTAQSTPVTPAAQQPSDIKYVKIGGTELKVDLALTPGAQAQGLSGRKSLASDTGMLFVFATPSKYAFWMKDMNFSIDMIWLDQSGTVVYIAKNASPKSYPNTFVPNKDANYVLEVASGFSAKHNLKIGDKTDFVY